MQMGMSRMNINTELIMNYYKPLIDKQISPQFKYYNYKIFDDYSLNISYEPKGIMILKLNDLLKIKDDVGCNDITININTSNDILTFIYSDISLKLKKFKLNILKRYANSLGFDIDDFLIREEFENSKTLYLESNLTVGPEDFGGSDF